VNAHEDDVVDVPCFEQVPNLYATVADGILALFYAQRFDLLCPWCLRIEPLGREFLYPNSMFSRIIILTTICLIERIHSLFFGWDLLAPLADLVWKAGGGRGRLGTFSCRSAVVETHACTWSVDDECALTAGFFEHFVHARDHLDFTRDGILAMMHVPHVTDDDGRARR
jgi:hypothetical protein